jgi:hypothetical protein
MTSAFLLQRGLCASLDEVHSLRAFCARRNQRTGGDGLHLRLKAGQSSGRSQSDRRSPDDRVLRSLHAVLRDRENPFALLRALGSRVEVPGRAPVSRGRSDPVDGFEGVDMRTFIVRSVGVSVLFALAWATVGAAQGRVVRLRAGLTISDQITGEDTEVTLDGADDPPLMVPPPAGMTWLRWRMQSAALVFVAQAADIRSFVTPDGRSIHSVVSFQVLEVLKPSPSRRLAAGDRYEWETWGGTVKVKGAVVHAAQGWTRPVKKNGQYLIFAAIAPEGDPLRRPFEIVTGEAAMFEVTRAGLPSLWNDRVEPSISDESLEAVKSRAAAYIQSPGR